MSSKVSKDNQSYKQHQSPAVQYKEAVLTYVIPALRLSST